MTATEPRNALIRILAATGKLSARTTYYAASLGALALIAAQTDLSSLPAAVQVIAGGLGVNLLSSMIDRVAQGEAVGEDDMTDAVQYAIQQTRIADALTEDEFRRALTELTGGVTLTLIQATLEAGNRDIAERLLAQMQAVQQVELRLSNQLSSEFAALHRRLDRLTAGDATRKTAQPRSLRVFISSPGDVVEERALAADVVRDLSYHPEFKGQFFLEPLRWDDPKVTLPLPANETAQASVNRYLIKPSQCDLVLVILWSKLGTKVVMDGEAYLSGTHYEYSEALEGAARNHGIPEVWVYRRTEPPNLVANDIAECRRLLDEMERVDQFFDTFNDADGRILRNYNRYETPDAFRRMLEGQLATYLRYLRDHPLPEHDAEAADALPALPVWEGSPFPGLRAFTPQDAPIFFGRERETADLTALVRNHPFVAVVGASGSGKSSLVGAGLLPRLQTDAAPWHIVSFKPGAGRDDDGVNPFAALYDALRMTFPDGQFADEQRRATLQAFATQPSKLTDFCRMLAPQGSILIFIDQFEETFTLVPERLRPLFVDLLVATVQRGDLHLVLTMRSDFFPQCVAYPKLSEWLRAGSFTLAAPRLSALYDMITRPAARAALTLEDGLAAQLLEDVGSEPGNLALLAYALDELYLIAAERGDRRLTFADYRAIGGVQQAIGTRAKATFAALRLDQSDGLLRRTFHALVEVDARGVATRRRAALASLNADPEVSRLITAFTDARLLTTDGYGDTALVEVAHEALFRSWDALAAWIQTYGDDLRLVRQFERDALDWQRRGSPPELQPLHEQLQFFEAALARLQMTRDMLDPLLQTYTEPEAERLVRELERPQAGHERRRDIGDRLAVIGDRRRGVGVIDGIPDIEWLPVAPGGEVKIESKLFTVEPFYIAKYPVTYVQFEAFRRADDGFDADRWWDGLPAEYKKQEMEQQRSKTANSPRDSVSWYQAVAFTRWLTAQYDKRNLWSDLVGTRYASSAAIDPASSAASLQIRLPTEWEWQWAAQGGSEARTYPWGEDWEEGQCCNTSEAGLNRSTAVGMYPAGAALCRALDMSGNVWEWCLNKYKSPEDTDTNGTDVRLLRGGSWNNFQLIARAAFRDSYVPYFRYPYWGFRLVVVGVPITKL